MASRSLTDVYMFMRNNAVQNRNIYHGQNLADLRHDEFMPPTWIHELDQAQFELSKLQGKINELKRLQTKNLHRPSLDDKSSEEVFIENLTRDITQILNSIHKVIQLIKSQSQNGTKKEQRLKQNVVRTLALSLQKYTIDFRHCQSSYNDKIKLRDERLDFFDGNLMSIGQVQNTSQTNSEIDKDFITKHTNKTSVQTEKRSEESNKQLVLKKEEKNQLLVGLDKIKKINKEDCKIS